MTTTNLFYYDPKKIDLSKLREHANRVSTKGGFRTPPEPAIIHYHDSEDTCRGARHERYRVREDTKLLTDEPPFEVFQPNEDSVMK